MSELEITNAQLERAFHGGLKESMTAWAIQEGLRLDQIGSFELGHDQGTPVLIVNLSDGRRRAFPFEVQGVH